MIEAGLVEVQNNVKIVQWLIIVMIPDTYFNTIRKTNFSSNDNDETMKIKPMIHPGRMGVSYYINVELVMVVVLINRAPLVILIYPGTLLEGWCTLTIKCNRLALIIIW